MIHVHSEGSPAFRMLILWLAGVLVVAGFSQQAVAQAAKLDKVTVRISWFANGEEAYWAYGIKHGIFAAEGIDLQVLEGSGSAATLRSIGEGTDRFGSASAYEEAGLVTKGLPVKMIANLVPVIPSSILYFEGAGITKPKDLEGKRVAFTAGDINHVAFKEFAKANGVDASKVKDIYFDARGKVTAFMTGEVDALAGFYTFSVPTIEEKLNKKVKYLRYADYGVALLGEGIVVNTKYLDDRSLNCRFVRAATRARAEAAKHPDEAISALLEMFPKAGSPEIAKAIWIANSSMPRSSHAQSKPLGYMPDEDWNRILELLKSAGGASVLPASAYYTNEFVDCR